MKIVKKLHALLIWGLVALTMVGCAVNSQTDKVGLDMEVFNKNNAFTLFTTLAAGYGCYELFDGHGSQPGWTAACTLVGFFGGKTLANHFWPEKTQQVAEYNKTGQTSSWPDPDTGYMGSVTPTNTVYTNSGPCRDVEFRSNAPEARDAVLHSTMCRDNTGIWHPTST